MKGIRVERLQEELRREIGEILQSRVRDPRIGWVSVVRVEISNDLSHAKVFVSVLGSDEVQEQSLRALSHAAPFVRSELGRRVRLRRLPEIQFRADLGISSSLRIHQVLRELGLLEPGAGGVGEGIAREEERE